LKNKSRKASRREAFRQTENTSSTAKAVDEVFFDIKKINTPTRKFSILAHAKSGAIFNSQFSIFNSPPPISHPIPPVCAKTQKTSFSFV